MEAIIQTEKLSHIYSAGTPFEHGALIDVDFTAYRGASQRELSKPIGFD